MKKFGLSRSKDKDKEKEKEKEKESKKDKPSKSSSKGPNLAVQATGNPYADVDPSSFEDPYTQGSNRYPSAPGSQASPGTQQPKPPYARAPGSAASNMSGAGSSTGGGGGMGEFRREKSGVPPGGYGGGYGGNRYGSGGPEPGPGPGLENGPASGMGVQGGPPPRRPGGYGGLGGADRMDSEAGRAALFGGAPQRQQHHRPGPVRGPGGPGGPHGNGNLGPENDFGNSTDGMANGGYPPPGPAYGDRQLTAEEEEEEDVAATKQEIRFMKQSDVSSTRNALRLAAQAEETGASTLARLGAQGERIHATEQHLDQATSQNRIAEERARELKTLNRSMFAVHVGNPFTSTKRREAQEQAMLDRHRGEREERDRTRSEQWTSRERQDGFQRGGGAGGRGGGAKGPNLVERSKYQFEADSEDEEMENEIDSNLDALHGAAKRMGNLGRAMGTEVDNQNRHIDRITKKVRLSSYFSHTTNRRILLELLTAAIKQRLIIHSQTDVVDDQIAMNRGRLERIK